jgi:hypothetical protein
MESPTHSNIPTANIGRSTNIDYGFAALSERVSKNCEDFRKQFGFSQTRDVTIEIDNRISRTLCPIYHSVGRSNPRCLGPNRPTKLQRKFTQRTLVLVLMAVALAFLVVMLHL